MYLLRFEPCGGWRMSSWLVQVDLDQRMMHIWHKLPMCFVPTVFGSDNVCSGVPSAVSWKSIAAGTPEVSHSTSRVAK